MIVKVDTDAGLVGWGEAKAGVGRLWEVLYNTPREGYALDRGHMGGEGRARQSRPGPGHFC